MKLLIQFVHVAKATPFERNDELWTSAGMSQPTGPNERPKVKTKVKIAPTPIQASMGCEDQSSEYLPVIPQGNVKQVSDIPIVEEGQIVAHRSSRPQQHATRSSRSNR
jgi:hypothetical protein